MNPDSKQLLAVTQREVEKLRRDHNDLRSLILTRKRSPKKWRTVGGGGGRSDATNATTYGYVTQKARKCQVIGEVTTDAQHAVTASSWYRDPDEQSPHEGRYVLCEWNELNQTLEVPNPQPGETIPPFRFFNLSEHYDIDVGSFIEVQTQNVGEEIFRFGKFFDPVDALLAIMGEDGQSLVRRPEGGGTPETVAWADRLWDVSYDPPTGQLRKQVNDAAFEVWGQAEPCPNP